MQSLCNWETNQSSGETHIYELHELHSVLIKAPLSFPPIVDYRRTTGQNTSTFVPIQAFAFPKMPFLLGITNTFFALLGLNTLTTHSLNRAGAASSSDNDDQCRTVRTVTRFLKRIS